LDEVLEAARLFALPDGESDVLLKQAEEQLAARAMERCGREWVEQGMLNLPTCYDECSQGIAVGHILWLHKLLVAYGMYGFCKERYNMLETCAWNPKKSFEENVKKM